VIGGTEDAHRRRSRLAEAWRGTAGRSGSARPEPRTPIEPTRSRSIRALGRPVSTRSAPIVTGHRAISDRPGGARPQDVAALPHAACGFGGAVRRLVRWAADASGYRRASATLDATTDCFSQRSRVSVTSHASIRTWSSTASTKPRASSTPRKLLRASSTRPSSTSFSPAPRATPRGTDSESCAGGHGPPDRRSSRW
jgi:hypothetical protein